MFVFIYLYYRVTHSFYFMHCSESSYHIKIAMCERMCILNKKNCQKNPLNVFKSQEYKRLYKETSLPRKSHGIT